MKTTKILAILVLALGLLVFPVELAGAAPMGTAFSYQGRLVDDSSVANGQYDFQFKVFDNPDVSLGSQQGSTIYINELNVIDGYFTAELDFGSGIFTGDARWLEIGVRPGADTGSFTILSPLQEIKPTPHAIHATHALQADEANTLNGLDSSAFAVTAHSHDGVYALISHTHSGSDSELTWGNLADIPAGFSDGIDDIGGTDSDWTISVNDMYSNVSGNVGIGTSSPLSKLSVGGNGQSGAGVYGGGTDLGLWGSGSSVGVWGEDSDDGSHGRLGFATYGVYGSGSSVGVYGEDSDSGSYGRLGYGDWGGYFSGDGYFSGNVGIGTPNPGQNLSVWEGMNIDQSNSNDGSISPSMRFGSGSSGEGIASKRTSGGNQYGLDFYTGVANRMSITSSGNVGIGTTSPDSLLEVNKSQAGQTSIHIKNTNTGPSAHVALKLESDGGSASIFRTSTSYHPSEFQDDLVIYEVGGDIAFCTTHLERMRILSGGNVGIGTTNPQGKLDVNGSIYQRGGLLHADYVFEPGYELEPIEEHSESMWQNKHLPAIPKGKLDEDGQEIVEVGAHRRGIVEELEKAHIYIEQLHKRVKALEEKLMKLEAGLNDVQ